jgi:hypothetical protein
MPDIAPTELERHRTTISMNIPRLRRYRIREFASSIPGSRAPKTPSIYYGEAAGGGIAPASKRHCLKYYETKT